MVDSLSHARRGRREVLYIRLNVDCSHTPTEHELGTLVDGSEQKRTVRRSLGVKFLPAGG